MLHKYSDFKLLSEKHKVWQPSALRLHGNQWQALVCDQFRWAYTVHFTSLFCSFLSPQCWSKLQLHLSSYLHCLQFLYWRILSLYPCLNNKWKLDQENHVLSLKLSMYRVLGKCGHLSPPSTPILVETGIKASSTYHVNGLKYVDFLLNCKCLVRLRHA